MKEMREIHKFTWRMPSAARLAALAVGILATTGVWATDYYKWVGGEESPTDGKYQWNLADNWQYSEDGETYSTATQYPTAAADVVSIPDDSSVETLVITGVTSRTGTLTINRDVTFTGSFVLDTISTNGEDACVLTLDGVTLTGGTGLKVAADVCFKNTINQKAGTPTFSGKITGDGTIRTPKLSGSCACGIHFTGDASDFEGIYYGEERINSRDNTQFANGSATSAKAYYYEIGQPSSGNSLCQTDGTYYFGRIHASNFSLKNRSNTTIEVGARTDGVSVLTIGAGYVGTSNKIVKRGTNTLTLNAPVAELDVTDGLVVFNSSLPTSIVMSDDGSVMLNDYFNSDFMDRLSFESIDTTISLYVDTGDEQTIDEDFSGMTGGFTKQGAGTLTFSVTPAWTGTTTVEEGLLIVPSGTTLTLDSDTTASTESGDTIIVYNKNDANVWTGSAGDNLWATASNWSLATAPSSSSDIVVIPSAATIAFGSTAQHTGLLTIADDVTLSGSIYIDKVYGSGTLTLSNASLSASGTIYTDLQVKGTVSLYNKNTMSQQILVYGAFSGDADVTAYGNGVCFRFYGDTSGFAGTYKWSYTANRDSTTFQQDAHGSADAEWTLAGLSTDNGCDIGMPMTSGSTNYFGKLTVSTRWTTVSGSYRSNPSAWYKNMCFVIGGKANTASTFIGTLPDASTDTGSNAIRKVGETSTLSVNLTAETGTIEVEEGTLYLTNNLPKYLTITGKDAVLYVHEGLDASSLVASGLNAYTVTKSDSTETVSDVAYYKYTLTVDTSGAIAYIGSDNDKTYYTTIAEAIADADDGDTIVVTGEGGDITIPAGRSLSFTTSGDGSITSVTGEDGNTVTASDSVYTYTCPALWTANNSLTGTTTLDGDYYTASDLYVPKNTSGAVATLNIGEDTSLRAKATVYVAKAANSTGRINVTDGGVFVNDTAGSFIIGDGASANGTLNIDGGVFTNDCGDVRIGLNATGTGTINVKGSGKFVHTPSSNRVYVGDSNGTGYFNVSDSAEVDIDGSLTLGKTGGNGTSTGYANISGGTVYVAAESYIGDGASTGELNVSGGKMTFAGAVRVSTAATSSGTINVTGGELDVKGVLNIAYGANSTGTVSVAGGKLTATSTIYLGGSSNTGASGVMAVSDGEVWAHGIELGNKGSQTNTLAISGGDICVTNALSIAGVSGCLDNVIVSGGTLTVSNVVYVGRAGGAEGTMTVSGGTVEVPGSVVLGNNQTAQGHLVVNGDDAIVNITTLQVGKSYTTNTVNVSAGKLTVQKLLIADANSKGDMTVSGGEVSLTDSSYALRIGAGGADSEGTLTISDDAVVTSASDVYVSYSNTTATKGTLTLNGGMLKAKSDGSGAITLGRYTGSTAALNLNGGIVFAKKLTTTEGVTATLNLNGGVLAASTANQTLIASGITTTIGENGAIISNDVAGVAIAADFTSEETAPTLKKLGSGDLALSGELPNGIVITVTENGGSVTVKDSTEAAKVTLGENTVWQNDTTLVYSGIAIDGTATAAYADGDTAATVAAKYSVSLTTEQVNQGLSTDYYKIVASLNDEKTTWTISVAFADEVTPDFTGLGEGTEPMVLTSDSVTFNISNMKNGLYYGVFSSEAPTTELDISQVTLDQMTSTHTPTLSATINSADTVKFYRVVVSDADNE